MSMTCILYSIARISTIFTSGYHIIVRYLVFANSFWAGDGKLKREDITNHNLNVYEEGRRQRAKKSKEGGVVVVGIGG